MPTFHVFNTYGFGNERHNPNQNNNNMPNSTDGNAINQNTGSIATITTSDGLVVSKRKNLRKRQLKAFKLLCASTHVSCLSKQGKIECWNFLDANTRNNPNLVELAIKSAPYYRPGAIVNLTSGNVEERVRRLIATRNITLCQEDGKTHVNLFDYVVKNAEYIHNHYRYDSVAFVSWLNQRNHRNRAGEYNVAFDVTKTKNDILQNWENIRHCATMAHRIHSMRASIRDEQQDPNSQYMPIRSRVVAMYDRIYQTRPIHWTNSLNELQQRIANRMRPQGACVGIELEFVANNNSDIMTWSDEDFPQQVWHSFKHDGSITSQHDDERVAAFQEYTCFINSNNPEDWKSVRTVMKTLTSNGAMVNNSCGCHVHIDMRHKSQATYYRVAGALRTAFNNWAHRMVSHRRAYSRYCGIQNDHQNNRYTAVNVQCWNEHRTLEVRVGMPTLNFSKLYLWTQFLKYLADNHTRIETFDEFMTGDAPLDVKLYVIKRISTFASTYSAQGFPALPGFDKYTQQLENVNTIGTDFTSQYYQGSV